MRWEYDNDSKRYIVRSCEMIFPNFSGEAQAYNAQGKRNFRLVLDDSLANEMKENGVFVKDSPSYEDPDEVQHRVKVGVYADADIRFLSNGKLIPVSVDEYDKIDAFFKKGLISNGEISIELHISKNSLVSNSMPYLRVDSMLIPLRKSKLFSQFENAEEQEGYDEPF